METTVNATKLSTAPRGNNPPRQMIPTVSIRSAEITAESMPTREPPSPLALAVINADIPPASIRVISENAPVKAVGSLVK